MTVSVYSPMTSQDYVKSIHVFNEKNPQPNIGNFYLGPRAGRAQISTRIRLADSQKIVAIAHLSDGSFWSASVDVVGTLAACTAEAMCWPPPVETLRHARSAAVPSRSTTCALTS